MTRTAPLFAMVTMLVTAPLLATPVSQQGTAKRFVFGLPPSVGPWLPMRTTGAAAYLRKVIATAQKVCHDCARIPGIEIVDETVANLAALLDEKMPRPPIVRQSGTFMLIGGSEKSGRVYYQLDIGGEQLGIKAANGRFLNDAVIDIAGSGDLLVSHRKDNRRGNQVESTLMVVPTNEEESQYVFTTAASLLPRSQPHKAVTAGLAGLAKGAGSPPLYYRVNGRTNGHSEEGELVPLDAKTYRSLFGAPLLLSNRAAPKTKDLWAIDDMVSWYGKYVMPTNDGLDFDEAIAKRDLRAVSQRALQAKVADALSRPLPKLEVRYVDDRYHYGLFPTETLEPGTILGSYTGLIRRLRGRMSNFTYYMGYAPEGVPGTDWYVLDGKAGNALRFANHNPKPNADWMPLFRAGAFDQIFSTIEEINDNQQIFIKYGDGYWVQRKGLGRK